MPLSLLEAGLADVVSPVTVPFQDAGVTSHADALAALRSGGSSEERWFESRIVLQGSPVSATPEYVPLEDGIYDHRDFFQVLPGDRLLHYCIPNASPIWRTALHDRVGYFDETSHGCLADLALWVAAGAAGFRFRQVSYPALFFISDDQAHRRQTRDDRRLWSVALRAGNDQLQAWAARRCFDLSQIGGTYGPHHFLGWNWVRDQVSHHFVNTPGNLLLDLFVERRLFWYDDPKERSLPYTRDWLGFVHTTPHQSGVYQANAENLLSLLKEPGFLRSLPFCRGIVVLSETNRTFLSERLRALGWNIPVFRLFHPNIPIDLSLADEVDGQERARLRNLVFHVGWHLRSFASFAQLAIDRSRKVLLVPPHVHRDFFVDHIVNKDLGLSGLGTIDEYVEHIHTASPEEYQRILRWGTLFVDYLEPAGSNLISECISAEATLVINRHPAFEEYLGSDYPLFYDTSAEAHELIGALARSTLRDEVRNHMRRHVDRLSVARFCRELERIGRHVYATYR